ncbi:major urinary protein 4-like [Apodemus sylvaticus]|uniref:major urinary protein 4-like n=1 Tax=Apodemus sylvaticus TaxID=10129 RepID=UPI002244C80C|nr:major urinary protein 4-like [Apodemus sylvaticus]
MKLLLLLLLLCLGLSLVCVHAGEASSLGENFDAEQISGDWYSIVLASDKREKIEEHGSMRVFVEHIEASEDSLAFKLHTVENGECTELFLVADKTEKAGEYYVNYDGDNTFTILKTDHDNYIMFHMVNVKDGKSFQLMELYGKEPDLSPDIKEEFAELCEEHGIPRGNVIDLTKTDRCLEARD